MVLGMLGDLDLSGVAAVRSASIEVTGDDWRHVVVDLTGVDFVDSAGMGALIGLRRRCRLNDGDCVLAAPSAAVLRVLQSADLERIFRIYATTAEARVAVRGTRT